MHYKPSDIENYLVILTENFTLPFAIEEIKKNTTTFSKRQLTWFKRNENTKWFDYATDRKEIIDYIENLLK